MCFESFQRLDSNGKKEARLRCPSYQDRLDNSVGREIHPDRRALTKSALDGQSRTVQCEQFSTDRQPKTAATEFPVDRGIRLLKGLAQRLQGVGFDADAGIGHDQGDPRLRMLD